MKILGHGIDVVEPGRVGRMVEEHGERFLERCFTQGERGYVGEKKRMAEHLAGRFAVKEAVMKALGTGLAGGIQWTDVEVVRLESGRPEVVLHGQAKVLGEQMGVKECWVSISHVESMAMASVILVG